MFLPEDAQDRGSGKPWVSRATLTNDNQRLPRRAGAPLRPGLGPDMLDVAIVTTGKTAYGRPDGVAVIPAALLGPSTRIDHRTRSAVGIRPPG